MPVAPAGLTPATRIALFYGSLFGTQGVASVFAGIWFAAHGISDTRIGVINAAPVLVLLALNLWIGRLADRADDWRRVIVIGAAASGVTALLLALATGFWSILLVWTLTNAAYSAIVPVIDAAAMRLSRREGFDFSANRAWATVGYLVMLVVTGSLLSGVGVWLFLPLFCALALVRGALAFGLPRFRAPAEQRAPSGATLRQSLKTWFVLPLVGGAIVLATHLVLGAFQSLLWADQGLPEHVIGGLIALGAASEAAAFFLFRRLAPRVAARRLILLAGVVATVRWTAFGFSPGVALLVPLQMLHGITYALCFLGCISFITNWTSEDIAAEAQSFFTVLQQGFSVVALVAFGWLAGHLGAHAYLALAVVAAGGALPVWLSMRLQQPQATTAR
jgi:PPP family 3-phenylpropionic acid transporter